MALNNSQKEIIAYRRSVVAQLRLRGLPVREIAQHMAQMEILDPKTKRPWSLGTVHGDLQAVKEQWRREAQEDTDLLMAGLLAEGREVRRRAWEKGDLGRVQRGIDQEMHLLGLDRDQPGSRRSSSEAVRSRRSGASMRASREAVSDEIEAAETGIRLDQLAGPGGLGDVDLSDLVPLAAAAFQNAAGAERAALIDVYDAFLDAASALAARVKAQMPAPGQDAVEQEGSDHVTE